MADSIPDAVHAADLAAPAGAGGRRNPDDASPDGGGRVAGHGTQWAAGFSRYHDVLSRSRWSALAAARLLLLWLVATFAPAGPVVIGLDDTIERRWGAKIAGRGIYRDPVRSSHGHFVKASGLRWLSAMLLAPVPWARRIWALPFLTVLMPSQRWPTGGASVTSRWSTVPGRCCCRSPGGYRPAHRRGCR